MAREIGYTELCEITSLSNESIEDAKQRHQRKLKAMLQALEEINLLVPE